MSVMTRSGRSSRQQLDQLAAGPGRDGHPVAQQGQDIAVVVPHAGLVVGDGDPQGAAHGFASRQGDQDRRPRAVVGAGRDPAPVGLDDPPGDGHAEAGPLGLGGVERLEEVPPLLGRRGPGRCRGRRRATAGSPVELGLGPVDVDLHGIVTRGERRCPGRCGRPGRGGRGRPAQAGSASPCSRSRASRPLAVRLEAVPGLAEDVAGAGRRGGRGGSGRRSRGPPRRAGGGRPGPPGCRRPGRGPRAGPSSRRASISRQAWPRWRALRLSWARPATIWPMAASRSACTARPLGLLQVGDVVADGEDAGGLAGDPGEGPVGPLDLALGGRPRRRSRG